MIFSVVIVLLGALSFGLDQGNFGGLQETEGFKTHWCVNTGMLPADTPEKKYTWKDCNDLPAWGGKFGFVMWGATLIPVGAAFGALILGPVLSTNFGRRLAVCVGSLICFCGCLFSSVFVGDSRPLFMTMRFFTGFGVGVTCSVLPMYNSEVTVPSVRGVTGSLFQFFVAFGTAVGIFTNFAIHNWKVGMMLPGMAAVVVGALVWLAPESPRWLLQNGKKEEGRRALQSVRASDCTPELEQIEDSLKKRAKSCNTVSYGDLFGSDKNLRKRFAASSFLQFGQQFTGVNAFLSYSGTIFGNLGVKSWANPMFNVIMVVFVCVGLALIDSRVGGRRKQLIVASIMMSISMMIGGLTNYLGADMVTLVMIFIWAAGFQLAWGMIPWIYPSEIFSQVEKDKFCTVSASMQYVANTAICALTPWLNTYKSYVLFWTFGMFNFVILAGNFFLIKETKGVPVEEIPALFD